VDDFAARWSDPRGGEAATAFAVCDEVYHLITRDLDAQVLRTTLEATHTIWHGVAAVSASPPSMSSDRRCTAEAMRRFAASTIHLSCIAYDGEGFVAWEPR